MAHFLHIWFGGNSFINLGVRLAAWERRRLAASFKEPPGRRRSRTKRQQAAALQTDEYPNAMNFVNPWFFLGGLIVAVPILLHLIKREHARKIEFPTLMFLRRISKRTIRYQKLRNLLLLLLRVLAFILLALAFTRPFFERSRAAAAVGKVTNAHIILLDNSMSMSYGDRWNRAKDAAVGVVRGAGAGDKFTILEFSDVTTALTQLTSDSSDALAQIRNGVELTDHPTKYGQALRTAEKFALDAGTGKRTIHLISDFQKSGWAADEQDFRLAPGIELQHVDVGSDDFSNLAIHDVHVTEADQNASGALLIKASVMNFGTRSRKNVPARILVDGRHVAEKRIDIDKGGSQPIEFQLPGLLSGVHPVVLEVDDPALTRDNRFYLTVEARGKTPVLIVENSEDRGLRSSSFFLTRALSMNDLSPYRISVASPQKASLAGGGLVIWNGASGGGAAEQKKLQEFVRAGGGLAIVLPDSGQAADFNRSFGSWLPVKVEAAGIEGQPRRPSEDYILMTDIQMDHPIFRPFGNPHSGSFSSARFFDHARISSGPGAEVPARFDNGDPALVAIKLDQGRVLIFASSAGDESNDLPLKAVYAPFWHQMLRYLENFRERRGWLDIGETLAPKNVLSETALRQSKGNRELNQAVVVLDPAKQRIPIKGNSDQILADKAGFYEIRTMDLNMPVAVNTLARESDLTHGNPEEMTAGWLSGKPDASFVQDNRLTPEEQEKQQRIWAFLLIAVLVLFVSEMILSNYGVRMTNDEVKEKLSVGSAVRNS
jgi:hypothetical protein